jgi:hypothetical protein
MGDFGTSTRISKQRKRRKRKTPQYLTEEVLRSIGE